MDVAGLCGKKLILHVDLDGFYAQVEQRRLGLSADIPLAVQQWEGIIAINYAAKGRGVTRHMRVAEARAKCPELRCVHVQTLGGGSGQQEQQEGHAAGSTAPPDPAAAPGHQHAPARLTEGSAEARSRAKACLQRYRLASAEIMRVLQRTLSHGAVLEKGGLDEVYIDVTPMVDAELVLLLAGRDGHSRDSGGGPGGCDGHSHGDGDAQMAGGDPSGDQGHEEEEDEGGAGWLGDSAGASISPALQKLANEVLPATKVEGGARVDLSQVTDQRLVVAAAIAKRLRDAVLQDPHCGYTCSAGIAQNKVLAKIGSARNKPAAQTLILPRAVAGLMRDMPLGKIRGLGGKLGAELSALVAAHSTDAPPTAGASNTGGTSAGGLGAAGGGGGGGALAAAPPPATAGDVQQVPLEVLGRAVGERARWVFNIVRGIDDEPVKPKGPIKSINSCKSFNSTSDTAQLSRWMHILAEELSERLDEQAADAGRRPRTLVLSYRGPGGGERSVRCPMPQPRDSRSGPAPAALAAAGMAMLRRAADALPCARLALSATEFHDAPVDAGAAITRFFSSLTPTAPATPATETSAPTAGTAGNAGPSSLQRTAVVLPGVLPEAGGTGGTSTGTSGGLGHGTGLPLNHTQPPAAGRSTEPPAKRRRGVGGVGGVSALGPKKPQPRPAQAAALAPSTQPARTKPPTAYQSMLHQLLGPPAQHVAAGGGQDAGVHPVAGSQSLGGQGPQNQQGMGVQPSGRVPGHVPAAGDGQLPVGSTAGTGHHTVPSSSAPGVELVAGMPEATVQRLHVCLAQSVGHTDRAGTGGSMGGGTRGGDAPASVRGEGYGRGTKEGEDDDEEEGCGVGAHGEQGMLGVARCEDCGPAMAHVVDMQDQQQPQEHLQHLPPQQPHDAVAAVAGNEDDLLLQGVDLEEQRRILHDLEIQRLQRLGRGAKHGEGGGKAGAAVKGGPAVGTASTGRGGRAAAGAGGGVGRGAGASKKGMPGATGAGAGGKQMRLDALLRK